MNLFLVFCLSFRLALADMATKCGPNSDPVSCGQATVLRGQSHIGIPAACFNTVDAGPCSQDLIRIFYDSKTYTCKAFSYSGCGGNANRFVSIKNCYKLCHPYYRQRFVSLSADSVGQTLHALPSYSHKEETTTTAEEEAGGAEGEGGEGEGASPKEATPPKEEEGEEGGGALVPVAPSTRGGGHEGEEEENGGGGEETTTDLSPSDPSHNVMFLKDRNDPSSAQKPEIQVIHEYDSFASRPPDSVHNNHMMSANAIDSGGGLAMGHVGGHMGGDHSGEEEGPSGPQSKYGVLQNVGHPKYTPVGGYLKSGEGYKPQAIERPHVFYTKYGHN